MQGAGHEVVVLHYECPVTKQMQQNQLASMVKKMAIKIKHVNRKTSKTWFLIKTCISLKIN